MQLLLMILKFSSLFKTWQLRISLKRNGFMQTYFWNQKKVLFGDRKHGGLSLVSVRLQAQACLIRNFLEMSINPSFIHSQFSQNFYRALFLDECIKGLKPPPFYNKHFFETIKKAIESGHSVENMWVKHWYQFLLEESANHAEQSSFKIERSFPDINWNQVWVNIHLESLNCEEASFAFKSVHGLLPSDEKISTIFKKLESSCKFGCSIGVANLPHILFLCQHSFDIGQWLFSIITDIFPDLLTIALSFLSSKTARLSLGCQSKPSSTSGTKGKNSNQWFLRTTWQC